MQTIKINETTTSNNSNQEEEIILPVKSFIESLLPLQQRKITRVLSYIEEYGIVTAIPHIKKLAGTPL